MPRHADELALVLHSSGTTSAPKGIAHSSNTLRYATEGVCSRWGLTGEDIYLTVVEFGFVGGLVFGYLPVLLQGATGVLLSRWDPEEALRLIEAHRCTYVLAMPTHATDMILAAEQTDRDLSSMRVLAGPGLTPERRMAMHQAFGRRRWATTGSRRSPATPRTRPTIRRRRSCAPRAARTTARRSGSSATTASPLPAGTVGAVIVNGPSRFLGFLNNDDLTRASLTDWGGYRDRRPRDARRGRPLHLRRAQQGHHPPRRRDDRAGRGRARDPPPSRRSARSRSCRCPTTASASARARRSSPATGSTAPTLAELQEFLDAEGVAKYTWPESVEVFEQFPRTPSLKVVKRDVVELVLGARRRRDEHRCCGACTSSSTAPGRACRELLADDLRFSIVFSNGPGAAQDFAGGRAEFDALPRPARRADLDAPCAGRVLRTARVELVLGETRMDGSPLATFVAAARWTAAA